MTPAITFKNLVKTYGKKIAVNDLSLEVQHGRITGFLGPNGAGKSTSLRCLVGLARPTSGSAQILGTQYSKLQNPLQQVGVVLDSRAFHSGLSGRANLKVIAAAAGLPASRVAEVLEMVELSQAANQRVKGYSMGMRQRLSLAGALLGDPQVLVLDEPANGLDPAGIAWLRQFLRGLSAKGRTVLVSSHQLAEMQNTVDDVVIINRGKLIAAGPLREVIGEGTLEEAFLALTAGGLNWDS